MEDNTSYIYKSFMITFLNPNFPAEQVLMVRQEGAKYRILKCWETDYDHLKTQLIKKNIGNQRYINVSDSKIKFISKKEAMLRIL